MRLADRIFKRNDWYVTSPFGDRKTIITKNGKTGNFHYGCDYGTNREKWPQYALEDGVIISCGIANDGAKFVWVNYPRINKKLLHYHLDSICVKTGETVNENNILGYTGKTGKATGIHLHLGMKNSNEDNYQDPHNYDYQPKKTKETIKYKVVYGDTLSDIAEKFETTWNKIYEKNKAIIGENPNLIKPGQILEI